MAELATAWVSLRVSTQGMRGQVRKELTGIEADAQKTGQSMGSKISSGIGTALKRTAVGVGVAGGAALAAGLTKGIGRLNSIEQAEAKLSGLGNSASDVGSIMENALDAVRGTAYGLDEAATIAASAVAAGVKPGKDLERTLKLTGDAAAIAGTELSDMGSIVNKVATSDMMQMDVANQLMDAGIPILQMVAAEMGVTAEEARKLASDGKISFETFQNALEQGVGGAALKMGDTTQGAFKNMGAAAGRLGATLAGPFFDQAGGAFRGITELLDDLNGVAGPAMEQVAAWLERAGGAASDAFAKFRESEFARDAMADLGGIFRSLAGTASDVWPSLVKIAGALGDASAALGVSAWDAFVSTLEVAAGVLDALSGPLDLIANVMKSQPGLVTAALAAWVGFKTVPTIMGKLSGALDGVTGKLDPARASLASFGQDMAEQQRYAAYFGESLTKTGAAVGALEARMPTFGRAASAYRDVSGRAAESASFHMAMARSVDSAAGAYHLAAAGASKFGGVVGGTVAAGASTAAAGMGKLVDALGGPLNTGLLVATVGVAALSAATETAKQQQDALRRSSERLAESQHDVAAALAEVNGELSSDVWAELESQIGSTRDSMDELAATGPGVMGWMGGLSKASGQLYGAFKTQNAGMAETAAATIAATFEQSKMAGESEKAAEAISSLGLTNEEVAARVYGSQGSWDSFRSSLLASGEGGREAADHLGRLRAEFEQQKAAIDALPDGAYALAGAIGVIGDEASSASDKVKAMQAALDALSGGQISAEEAAFNYAETLRDVADGALEAADASGGLGAELINSDGRLDSSKSNASALRDELMGVSEGFLGAAIASGDANAEYALAGPALDTLAQKYGLTSQQVRDLAAQYGMVPDQVQTMITVANDDVAKGQVGSVLQALNGIPPGTTARVFVNNDQARAALEATGVEITNYDAKTGMADVLVDNQQALDGTNQAWGQVTDFGAVTETATVDVENSGVNQGVNESLGWLNRIPAVRSVRVVFNAVYQGFRDMIGGGGNYQGGAWDGAKSLRKFAAGGHSGYRLPTSGPGTDEVDGFLAFNSQGIPAARLDAGEWIINGRSSEKYNKELAAINAGVFPKLPGYAEGGRSQRTASEVLDFVWARNSHGQNGPLDGNPYAWAGINWGDCSAAMGSIARFMLGLAPFAARFATGNADSIGTQWGMSRGKGHDGDFRVAYYNGGAGGGHMWGTLPDGTNVEMRGGRGGIIGKDAWGINHPSGQQYLHVPGVQYKLAGIEGAEGLMPPGASTTWAGMAGASGTTSPGLYKSPGNSGQVGSDQPRTWSDMAAGAVSALVGGQVEDALGVFGVPNQLPPIIQAWQMLNEKPGGGPSDWDLSTAAAEVKRLDAAIKIREQVTGEAAKALEAMNGSIIGNADPTVVRSAEAELDKQFLELEQDRLNYERAQGRLKELLGARAAAVAEKDLTSASSASDLASSLAPDVSMPDELMRELKVTYDPAGGAEQWRPMVIAALKRNGFAATQREQDLMIAQIKSESGGDPSIVQQVQDVNSGGNEAQGLLQVIPGTFAAHRDPELPNDRTDPWANMNAALRYYKSRYGMDLGAMWGKGHGYNMGGWINGSGTKDSVPLVGAPGEFIVNRRAAAQNRDLLEQINAGRTVPQSSGGGVTYNIYAFDLDEAMARTSRREAQHAQTYMGAR